MHGLERKEIQSDDAAHDRDKRLDLMEELLELLHDER